ncbi:MAG: uracil-DNA glycosylase family protein [Bacillota bacterium]|nr:uracil-DNA glycosylase family protein [Bacillota bacterium]
MYRPEQFIEGHPSSPVWVISLNPKAATDWRDDRSADDLLAAFAQTSGNAGPAKRSLKDHPFFRDFERVSARLYELLGEENGVAHTDIVKCSSVTFRPRQATNKDAQAIVANCRPYLEEQLSRWQPRIVLCNGAPILRALKDIVKPVESKRTSYVGVLGGQEVAVVLSGFFGRLDNYAKARLGEEVESFMDRLGISG